MSFFKKCHKELPDFEVNIVCLKVLSLGMLLIKFILITILNYLAFSLFDLLLNLFSFLVM